MFSDGDLNAKIVVVEDLPTHNDVLARKLYMGGTTYTYETMLKSAGIKRNTIYTTTLFKEAGWLRNFYYDKACKTLKYDYTPYVVALEQLLLSMHNLKVIIPLGNASLQAITGVWGLTKWRGSILPVDPNFSKEGHKKWKVIPTYSPRDINVNYLLRIDANIDLRRAVEECNIDGIQRPFRVISVEPTFNQAKRFLLSIIQKKLRIATDIETRGHEMMCISFAISPYIGMSIPFYRTDMSYYWGSVHEGNEIRTLVKHIIDNSAIPKILQNGIYDFWFMGNIGYEPKGLNFDTMFGSHCMYAELSKDLGVLTSRYTKEPYYKFERTQAQKLFTKNIKPFQKDLKKCRSEARKVAKKRATTRRRINRTEPLRLTAKRTSDLVKWKEELVTYKDTIKTMMVDIRERKTTLSYKEKEFNHYADITYWTYNTKDSLFTYEIALKLEEELQERGLWKFFKHHYIEAFPIAYDISMHGLKVDEHKRTILAESIEHYIGEVRKELFEMTGEEFNTQSSQQMANILYNKLGLPPQYNKTRITTDAKALDRIYTHTEHPVVETILDLRKLEKLISTYLRSKLDDEHMRSQIDIAHTTSGRWSSKKSPWGSGGNLQNIPSGKTDVSKRVLKALGNNKNAIRDCFVPSIPGNIFVEIDLSNADTWYTAFLAKDRILMEALLNGEDTHCMVGGICYEKDPKDISKSERYVAKRVGHGFNYGMFEKTMSVITKLPLELVKGMYARLKLTRPAIPAYHQWVEEEIMEKKCLVNAFGRIRYFFGRTPFRWVQGKKVATPDESYRSGYSYIPQGSVTDHITNTAIKIDKEVRNKQPIKISTQTHDSLLFGLPPSALATLVFIAWKAFNVKQNPWGDEFTIPWEYTIGSTWGNMVNLPVKDGKIDFAHTHEINKKTGKLESMEWLKYVPKGEVHA